MACSGSGVHTLPVNQIVGGLAWAHLLRANVMPIVNPHGEKRFQVMGATVERRETLPTIEIYELYERYYVLDGNHHVAAPKLGRVALDTVITEFRSVSAMGAAWRAEGDPSISPIVGREPPSSTSDRRARRQRHGNRSAKHQVWGHIMRVILREMVPVYRGRDERVSVHSTSPDTPEKRMPAHPDHTSARPISSDLARRPPNRHMPPPAQITLSSRDSSASHWGPMDHRKPSW